MTYVGIDVSKATFTVAYSSTKTSKRKIFKNTIKDVHEFIQTISAIEHHCVLEATGNYNALFVYRLSEAGITTPLVKSTEDKELCPCHAHSYQDERN